MFCSTAINPGAEQERVEPERVSVYLIDDDRGISRALTLFLDHRDIAVRVVESGQECLDTYEPGEHRCVVVDVRLPDMTGFELLDRLAAKGHEPPAIIITGHGPPTYTFKSRQRPVARTFLKPFEPDDLYRAITQIVD